MAKPRQAASTATSAAGGSAPPRWSIAAATTPSPTASHCRPSRPPPGSNETIAASITSFSPRSGAIREAAARLSAANPAACPAR